MEKISLPFFYRLGLKLNPLAERKEDKDGVSIGVVAMRAQFDLRLFPICRQCFWDTSGHFLMNSRCSLPRLTGPMVVPALL